MIGTVQILTGDIQGLVGVTLGSQVELDRAKLALAVTVTGVAVTWEAHAHGAFAGEGNEAEAVSDELVVEDGGVDLDFDEVDGDGGDLGDRSQYTRYSPYALSHYFYTGWTMGAFIL